MDAWTDTVEPEFACPNCGEDRVDYLKLDDAWLEICTCETCFTKYEIEL